MGSPEQLGEVRKVGTQKPYGKWEVRIKMNRNQIEWGSVD